MVSTIKSSPVDRSVSVTEPSRTAPVALVPVAIVPIAAEAPVPAADLERMILLVAFVPPATAKAFQSFTVIGVMTVMRHAETSVAEASVPFNAPVSLSVSTFFDPYEGSL